MWDLVVSLLISAVSFFIAAKLMKSIKVNDFGHAFIIALVIALLNGTLGVVLEWILPDKTLNFFTLGFFQFVMDAIIIWVAGKLMKEFYVKNFLSAIILAVIVAFFTTFSCWLIG